MAKAPSAPGKPAPAAPSGSALLEFKVEAWPLANVKPYEKNPRKNEGAIDAVAARVLASVADRPGPRLVMPASG